MVNCRNILCELSSIDQKCMKKMGLFFQPYLTSILNTALIDNSIANVTTIVAPVGISKTKEAIIPIKLPIIPNPHPKSNRFFVLSKKSNAATAGMIKNENTSNTPAIFTELVTTKPNVT